MTTRRARLHSLKQELKESGSPDAMMALLQRSVKLGHKRLALVRCLQAEGMGIDIQPAVLAYCVKVAATLTTEELAGIATRARQAISGWRL